MILQWPQQIPPAFRRDVEAGPKCFTVDRSGKFQWKRQRVVLTSNLLVHVTCGSVIIERGRNRVDVHQGCACLLLPGEMIVTEVPDRMGLMVNSWTFFPDRVIGEILKPIQGLDDWVAMVRPVHHDLHPFVNRDTKFWAFQAHRPVFTDGFKPAFRQLVHTFIPSVFMFLASAYYSKATRLNLWLETLLLSGLTAEQLPDAYPGGRRLFQFHWATYEALPLRTWLRRRKMQLAAVWIRHGDLGLAAIRQALGYTSETTFATHYKREHGIVPIAETRMEDGRKLPWPVLQCKLRPFWHRDETEVRERLFGPGKEADPVSTGSASARDKPLKEPMREQEAESNNSSQQDNKQPDLRQFWALTSTAVPELFAA